MFKRIFKKDFNAGMVQILRNEGTYRGDPTNVQYSEFDKKLIVSFLCLSILTACSSTLTNQEIKETLMISSSGALKMLLVDSDVYQKATNRELDPVTWELLKSTKVKLDILRGLEERIGGSYTIEDNLSVGKMNQLCLINNFMLAHKKEFPKTLDLSGTYDWIESKQKIFLTNLNEILGDKRMKNDCRS
ncbi:hypothetical protein [Acinetobacter sp. NIPH 2699]|uniref:hypothetical protein n=1 Tax=Acinetobacter sp. NIPH 2699 TaxID=2923433 RepID=UPI001F4BCBAA|nr:hypothetical protein [Acinetobacter sp. NIPH 2699]MCH7336961.1 hypothetical protein [Acinetobacter sp. NIPH 2699]